MLLPRGDNLLKYRIELNFHFKNLAHTQKVKRKLDDPVKVKVKHEKRKKNKIKMGLKKQNLFSDERGFNNSIESYTTEIVPCITKLPLKGSETPFKFLIKSVRGEFIDPNNIILYLQFKLWRKGDGGALKELVDGEDVAPYCGFLYTMFKDISVDFNGVTVYTTHQQYQHLAYLSLLLHAPHSLKDTLFTSALWDTDRPGAFNKISMAVTNLNPGAHRRATRVDKSTTCELKGSQQPVN